MSFRVLYVSYDGMTDPLGESQVLPYVVGLARRGYAFHVLSFEKPDRLRSDGARISAVLEHEGIFWHPLRFTARPRLLAKALDAYCLRRAVRRLHDAHDFHMLHCRSYPAAGAALALKNARGVPYLFDMRGFWVDERVEGGIWNVRRFYYRWLYRYFKGREQAYLRGASAVVSLTEAAVEVMKTWPGLRDGLPVQVIPCCVDTELFSSAENEAEVSEVRRELGLPADALVLAYLGSIGTWYLLDDMLRFFRLLLDARPDARFLFVTRHDAGDLARAAERHGVPPDRLVIRAATRPEVPRLLRAADVSVFFIRPTFSKTASCPTKLAELMALGIPVVCNAGVGDVDAIVREHQAGAVVEDLDDETLRRAAAGVPGLLALSRGPMVEGAARVFSLEAGVESYAALYDQVLARGEVS